MTDKMELLKRTRLFVLDMDGTFYLGDRILPGAAEFLQAVKAAGKEYLFFTNNSSRSPRDYMAKLARMGCPITRDEIMTSGDVTIRYLLTHCPDKTVYLVGTPPLMESFAEAGIRLVNEKPNLVVIGFETAAPDPKAVVLGFDTTLTYEKLSKACTFIREGAAFLATHLDINCPTETGFIPDCGSFCAAISLSTGKQPKYLGKPFAETVEMVLDKTGYSAAEVAFVGDRLYTDVATGVKNGAAGVLVLTGETHPEDVAGSDVQPDAIFASLGEMGQALRLL